MKVVGRFSSSSTAVVAEATAAEEPDELDEELLVVVVELLVRLNKEGQTMVLVTHNPAVAVRAQRTVRMRDGRIESAPPPARSTAPTS